MASLCVRSAVDTALEIYHLSRTVDRFYGLLEAGDEEADDDGGDADEEVAPGVGRGVGRVRFEHAWLRAVGCPVIPYLEIAVPGGWATRCAEEAGTLW